ncbi:MAG: DUF4214 domain-containing protein [Pseudomonadota bacterium]
MPSDDLTPTEPQAFLNSAFTDWAIIGLYNIVLGRQPDREGFEFWTERLESGAFTLDDMFTTFIKSDEAQRLDNRVFDADGDLVFPGARIDIAGDDPHFVVGFLSPGTVNIAPLPGNRVEIGDDGRFDGGQIVVDLVDSFDFV